MEKINVTEKLEVGLNAVIERVANEDDSAEKYGIVGINVFATPAMIGLIESTSKNVVAPLLPVGFTTVGTKIDVQHLAATPMGMKVKSISTLTEISGKKLTFKIEVFDEVEQIGSGTHERFIVATDKFMERVNNKATK